MTKHFEPPPPDGWSATVVRRATPDVAQAAMDCLVDIVFSTKRMQRGDDVVQAEDFDKATGKWVAREPDPPAPTDVEFTVRLSQDEYDRLCDWADAAGLQGPWTPPATAPWGDPEDNPGVNRWRTPPDDGGRDAPVVAPTGGALV